MMKVTLVLCLLVFVATINAKSGGWSDEENATSEIQGIANEAKKSIESSAGVIRFPRFTVITYKKQMVAGVRYLLKIETNGGKYIHVKFTKRLGGLITSIKVKTGRKRNDPLEDF